MIQKSVPLFSAATCLTLLFIVYSVNGDRKLSTQCANENKLVSNAVTHMKISCIVNIY